MVLNLVYILYKRTYNYLKFTVTLMFAHKALPYNYPNIDLVMTYDFFPFSLIFGFVKLQQGLKSGDLCDHKVHAF